MTLRVERLRVPTPEAMRLLEEYYQALGVEVRDGFEAMRDLVADARSGWWLALAGDQPAGCVVLRAGIPADDAGECKRLYVKPAFRRAGVADALMDALETAAGGEGLRWVYLDTKEAFRASVALYERRGYEPCERYNNNPQASLFFRKRLL